MTDEKSSYSKYHDSLSSNKFWNGSNFSEVLGKRKILLWILAYKDLAISQLEIWVDSKWNTLQLNHPSSTLLQLAASSIFTVKWNPAFLLKEK